MKIDELPSQFGKGVLCSAIIPDTRHLPKVCISSLWLVERPDRLPKMTGKDSLALFIGLITSRAFFRAVVLRAAVSAGK
jgi:hypothetical protein